MPHRNAALILTLPLALAACGPADTDPGPGGVSAGEARALDEAAEMLEQRRPPAALPAEPPAPARDASAPAPPADLPQD